VHRKKNRRGFQPCHRAHALLLVALVESVAREVRVLFVFFQLNQQVIYGIVQVEKVNIRLKLQTKRLRISSREIFGLQSGFRFSVESINVGPLQPDHVECQLSARAGPFRILAQPRFQF
jgi:hypothetical protein